MKTDNKFLNATQKITSWKWFPIVFLPLSLVFVLIYSYTTSPLFVHDGMDSCVFKTMGRIITQGKTPYVDFFDHKGPILYFINALGQWIYPGRLGIFAIQVLWMSFTLLFLFKLAELFLRSDLSLAVTVLAMFLLSGVYEEGNQCEEWELLAIAASYYYAARFALKPDRSLLLRASFIWGICCGFIFFIRPNDAVSQIGGIMAGVFIYYLIKKDLHSFFKSLIPFVSAFVVVTIPVILYFAVRKAVPDLVYGLVVFNSLYSDGIGEMIKSCLIPAKLSFFLLFIPTCCMIYKTEFKNLLYFFIPVFAFSLPLTGSNPYPHYFITFIPAVLIFWIFLLRQRDVSVILISLSMFYCCSFASTANFIMGAKTAAVKRVKGIVTGDSEYKAFYAEAGRLVNMIPEEERDDVWNYNLIWDNTPNFSILFHFGIQQCNKVPYFPMYMVDDNLRKSDDFRIKQPKWIFVSHDADIADHWYKFTPDYEYIGQHYTIVGTTDAENGNLELYRRNY